jgi:hypothetical protein
MDYAETLRHLRREDGEIRYLCRAGSRVYGTAGPGSDEDFTVVLNDKAARQDLLFRGGANFVVHGTGTFQKALSDQSVFALECLFAPPEHRLKDARPPFAWKLDREKLVASATSRSGSDWKKAARTFEDEPKPAKKKLFHAIRVLMFARQIVTKGRISDFAEAAPLWAEIRDRHEDGWEPFDRDYGPLRDRLSAELSGSTKRR